MSDAKYAFPRSWQSRLLAYLIIDGSKLITEKLIKPEYFASIHHATIASTAIDLYEKHGVPLTFAAIKEAIRAEAGEEDDTRKVMRSLGDLPRSIKPIEEKLILERVRKFAQHQAIKISVRQSIDLLESDDIVGIEKSWNEAMQVGRQNGAGQEIKFFSSFKERRKRFLLKPDVIGTLITPLDAVLEAYGIHRKELVVLLGLPSSGKSFGLQHMAKAAVIQKKNTVAISLEMSAQKYSARLDASFTGVEIRELRDNIDRVERKLNRFERQFGDRLIIKEYPAGTVSVAGLRSYLLNLKLRGFDPEVLIVDYINLLGRSTDIDAENTYKGLGNVYVELRALAQELNMWCITAGQSNRAGFEAELVTMKEIGESFEGAMHSDVIITLNRTQEEKDKGLMRLFIAKNRNELDSIIIPISTNFAKGSFYKRR
jgi:replicative DNA helicase